MARGTIAAWGAVDTDIDAAGAVTESDIVGLGYVRKLGTDNYVATLPIPGTDTNGDFGAINIKTTGQLQTGDLVMRADDRAAHWRLREHGGFIEAINETTGERFRLVMEPLGGIDT